MFWFWLLFLILRLPSLFEPYWYGDEGVYLALGQAIRSGVNLYSQIHDNKPPAIYYLAAFSQTVFGFRLLLLLWMIPTIIVFKKLTLKFLSEKSSKIATFVFLILSSIPLIEGHIANAEIFMLLPTLLAFAIFPQKLFFSGLLLGLAFTFKVPVAVEFLFLFCWFFFIEKESAKFKKLFVFGFSFFIPTIISIIYFYFKKSLPEYLFAALLQNFGYLSSWSTGSHTASATSSGLPIRLLLMILFWVVLFFLYKKKWLEKKMFFVFGWFAATLFGVLLPLRPYPHYLIQTIPPFIILLFYFRRQLFLSLLTVFIFAFSLISVKFYFYPTLKYYKNFYQYTFRQISIQQYRSFFGKEINNIYQSAEYIKSHSTATDKIFVWSDDPYLYPLSDRLPAAKYTTAYHVIDFNGYQKVIDSFKSVNQPKIIIYNASMSNRPFPALDQFISDYYFLDNKIGPYYLFLQR
jgi:4-amino-4-deoxy-L-arabinose transferase-like glycosyltransferase